VTYFLNESEHADVNETGILNENENLKDYDCVCLRHDRDYYFYPLRV
jgi:hypothetical protein